jgi:protoporphyrinogen/coproporphyrinogen III oxidase
MGKRIAVIGGGMAGTAAAHTLRKLDYDVTIFEQNDRLGGRIHTMSGGGMTFELGAGFFTNLYTNIFRFLKENQLIEDLKTRKSQGLLMRGGAAYLLSPANLIRNKPISIGAQSKLFVSLLGVLWKWRRFDAHEPWRSYPSGSKVMSEALSGRYGQELLDYFIQPIFDGYCYWDAKRTSEAMWTLMCKLVNGPTYVLPNGLGVLPESAAKGCKVLLSHTVSKVTRLQDEMYDLTVKGTDGEKTERFDGVVCATTASVAKMIIADLSIEQEQFFSSVHYTSTVILARVYKLSVAPPNQAIAYPRKDGGILSAVTISSNDDATLVKIFASGASGSALSTKSDDEISMLLADAAELPDDFKVPLFEYVQRWSEALPEFTAEHNEQLRLFAGGQVESAVDELVFAGDYIGGPFMDGAFWSGTRAAERLHSRMSL